MRWNFLCLAKAESPEETYQWFQELGLQHGTKYLQVLGSRWPHITKRRALDHLYRLSTFIGNMLASSVLTCCFITPLTLFHLLTSTWVVRWWSSALFLLTFNHRLTVRLVKRQFPRVAAGQAGCWAGRRADYQVTAHLTWPGISIFARTTAGVLTTGQTDWCQTDREILWEW